MKFKNIDWSIKTYQRYRLILHIKGQGRKRMMQTLSTLWNFLQGRKTYLSAIVGTIIGVLYFFSYITPQQFEALSLVSAAFGLIGIRSAMEKFKNSTPIIVNRPIDVSTDQIG